MVVLINFICYLVLSPGRQFKNCLQFLDEMLFHTWDFFMKWISNVRSIFQKKGKCCLILYNTTFVDSATCFLNKRFNHPILSHVTSDLSVIKCHWNVMKIFAVSGVGRRGTYRRGSDAYHMTHCSSYDPFTLFDWDSKFHVGNIDWK